jgi:hypothetical protein
MGMIRTVKAAIKAYDRKGFGIEEEMNDLRELPGALKSLKRAAQAVADNWEQGDLAGAVNALMAEIEEI